ncbi:ATP-binding protein [Paenibacillus chungangensis]|uniref:ATP-binding protein n=1 Tax=Paenibacillus chungangensis TaxID=696535 RepID=A0ABW3HP56_9BACL
MGQRLFRKEWSFHPDHGVEKLAMRLVTESLQHTLPQETRIDDVHTVIAEACINAIEHGHTGTPITIRLHVYTDKFVIDVINLTNRMVKLPSTESAAHIWEKEQPRGWGLLFMRELTDEFAYGGNDEGFFVKMTYYVEGGAS